jgi:hypothetical protein
MPTQSFVAYELKKQVMRILEDKETRISQESENIRLEAELRQKMTVKHAQDTMLQCAKRAMIDHFDGMAQIYPFKAAVFLDMRNCAQDKFVANFDFEACEGLREIKKNGNIDWFVCDYFSNGWKLSNVLSAYDKYKDTYVPAEFAEIFEYMFEGFKYERCERDKK